MRHGSDIGPAGRGYGDPLVEAELRRRIGERGRITFAEFMEVALYLVGGGYYEARADIGRSGDFLTSPETHPLFGALLARLTRQMWRALGSPEQFDVIEYGAGTGSLCRQITEAAPRLDAGLGTALRYHIVERSAFLRALQQAKLLDLADAIEWAHPEKQAAPVRGCVLANEVVDSFPVHRVRTVGGELREVYVGLAGDRYVEALGPLSDPVLDTYPRDQDLWPREGAMIELNLEAAEWLRDASDRLEAGYLVTVDFGGSASDLYGSAGPRGGLKCFHRHGWSADPLDRPGLQDIAAPADFARLVRIGEGLGLEAMAEMGQSELLSKLGLGQAVAWLEGKGLGVEEREANRKAMLALADPAGLGAFRVLIQRKAAPDLDLERAGDEGTDWAPLLPAKRLEWPQ